MKKLFRLLRNEKLSTPLLTTAQSMANVSDAPPFFFDFDGTSSVVVVSSFNF
jgi:hypothetical protein